MFSRGFNNSLLSIKSPKWIQFTRFKSTSSTTPPTYFSEHLDQSSSPKPIFNEHITPPPTTHSPISSSTYSSSSSSESQSSRLSTFKDLSVIFSIVTLTYFAVDNYRSRIGLEARVLEQQMNNMKALALTQNNYNNQRRKRETQVLNERRNAQKREMKMVYHISMLRKQLIDAGLKPGEFNIF